MVPQASVRTDGFLSRWHTTHSNTLMSLHSVLVDPKPWVLSSWRWFHLFSCQLSLCLHIPLSTWGPPWGGSWSSEWSSEPLGLCRGQQEGPRPSQTLFIPLTVPTHSYLLECLYYRFCFSKAHHKRTNIKRDQEITNHVEAKSLLTTPLFCRRADWPRYLSLMSYPL